MQRQWKGEYTIPSGTVLKGQCLDGDGRALRSPAAVVKVEEVAAQALVENVGAAESQAAIAANRESRGIDCASLGRCIELELVIGCNVSSAAFAIFEDAAGEGELEGAGTPASDQTRTRGAGCSWSRAGSCSLWLCIGDLSDWLGGAGLRLTVGFLADWRSRAGLASLWLTVRYLRDWPSGAGLAGLGLTVRYLRDWRSSDPRSLRLTI